MPGAAICMCVATESNRRKLMLPDIHATHRRSGGIHELNEALLAAGVAMNQAGGLLKVSPDSRLLQSSTLADEVRILQAVRWHPAYEELALLTSFIEPSNAAQAVTIICQLMV